jgi:hypothetical protein
VQNLRQWLDHGPSGARVAAVQEFELPSQPPSAGHPSSGRLGDRADGHAARLFWVE